MVRVLQRFLVVLCLLTLTLLQIQSATLQLDGVSRNRTERRVASENRQGSCNKNEFRCNNGDCIPVSYRCDEILDCKDKSDEQNCGGNCMSDEFRCNNGKCIPSKYKCDNIRDCTDNSDETSCLDGCSSDQFTCGEGTCIPETYLCDKSQDCPDNSDEAQCDSGNGGTCGPKQFTCNDGKCIPDYFKCDKIKDCADNSDEQNCGHGNEGHCKAYEFKCGDGTCILKSYTCDTIKDCPDNSDEAPCVGGGSGGAGVVSGIATGCSNCGVKYPPDNRIMYGDETGVNEWPWHLYVEIEKDYVFGCGGALINEKYALTAAHCLGNDTKSVRIITGEHSVTDNSEPVQQKIPATKFIMHPHYGTPFHESDNDIAIVELSRPVTFSKRVRPICLPGPNDDFTGKTAWVTGWGTTETGSGSDVLLETSITMWSDSQCQQRGTTENMVCGLGETKGHTTDACTGDSGGPLMYKTSSGKWVLIGIVSHGPFPCAELGKPGVYSKVSKYLDWIKQHTKYSRC